MKKTFLFFQFFVIEVYTTNILVSNCGTKRCNGAYALIGVYDGCNLYKHSTEESIYIRTGGRGTWWSVSSFAHMDETGKII